MSGLVESSKRDGNESSQLTNVDGAERRRYLRYAVRVPARCIFDATSEMEVIIVDASNGGFGLNRSLPLEIDDRLKIDIPGIGIFKARVAWVSSQRSGIELLDEDTSIGSQEIDYLASLLKMIVD